MLLVAGYHGYHCCLVILVRGAGIITNYELVGLRLVLDSLRSGVVFGVHFLLFLPPHL